MDRLSSPLTDESTAAVAKAQAHYTAAVAKAQDRLATVRKLRACGGFEPLKAKQLELGEAETEMELYIARCSAGIQVPSVDDEYNKLHTNVNRLRLEMLVLLTKARQSSTGDAKPAFPNDNKSSPQVSPDSITPPACNPPSCNPPSCNPPSCNPPSCNPPACNPPACNPPSCNPPSCNPPSAPRSSRA